MTKDNVIIREATLDDIHAIVELWTESALHHAALEPRYQFVLDTTKPTEDYYSRQIQSENSCVIVAQSDDSVVGFMCVLIQERPQVFIPRKAGFVDGMFVSPSLRRQGIGTRLWNVAKKWVRKQGIDKIQLMVATSNPDAIEFWRKQGFSNLALRMELSEV